ncbi:hypothetical protein RN001_010839 [Aquatica leii]|uniref:Uncharacterized protein n=1 Tax=Aquatica leii TaxID=1421715 RepID=A0AAN7P8D4_9COLE|nr:hypothetical protein RN001_010839 [Aquatica leii]
MLRCFLSLIIIYSIVEISNQVGFSLNDNPKKKPSSPERKSKHEAYIQKFQDYQKMCAKLFANGTSNEYIAKFIIEADSSLDLNDTSIENKQFFGCLCKQFKLLRDDDTLNTEALGPFFDAAADEDPEAVEIQKKCNAVALEYTGVDYNETCFHVFSCVHDFDDDDD